MASSFCGFDTQGLRGSDGFPSPFMDMASLAMPDQHRNALDWCQYIWSANDTYRMAMERVIAYFLTEVDIGGLSDEQPGDDEKTKYKEYLNDMLGVLQVLQSVVRDRMCYGNGFASVIVPFRRYLGCPKCKMQLPLKIVYENPKFAFKFSNFEFHAKCQGCKFHGSWNVHDEPIRDENKLKIKRWDPHEIEILHDPLTDDCSYVWRIPADYKKRVRDGELYVLERASKQVIEAIKKNYLFLFDTDVIYHMKEPTLAGIKNHGWGISRLITSFRQIWYVAMLHRYNEAIAADYVIPFRLITPAPRAGGGASGSTTDPLLSVNMGDFSSQVRRMIRQRRRDPAGWYTLPFPVQYQSVGADANQLATPDLLNQGIDTLLNGAGAPAQMYRGDMTMQVAPVALRLFESTWNHLVHDMNLFLRWLVGRISQILSWETVTAKLRSVQVVDDINKQMAMLQLMMGQAISQTTGLRSMGIDFKSEQRQLSEEARFQAEQQAEVQEEMEQSAFGQQIAKGQPGAGAAGGAAAAGQPGAPAPAPGDPSQGGQPAGPVTGLIQSMSPNTPVTPEDLMGQADSLAQQLLGLPESQKDSELRMLKQKNELLHSIVSQKIKAIRQQAQTAGGSMVMASQFGQGQQPQGQ